MTRRALTLLVALVAIVLALWLLPAREWLLQLADRAQARRSGQFQHSGPQYADQKL